jgi:ergothioneine biosynthesis protein EgtB
MTRQAVLDALAVDRQALLRHYRETRSRSVELCRPLAAEDYRIQTMDDVSPPWWNLGHTTWFFAKNVLERFSDYRFDDPGWEYVLNSYYEAHGERLPRPERGNVGRPTTEEIQRFRRDVDRRMEELVDGVGDDRADELSFLVTTGIHHEQQHQELLVTEIKHILGRNPAGLRRAYCPATRHSGATPPPLELVTFGEGLFETGNLEGGWCWDNELPVHKVYLAPYALANRLVTVGEYLEFIDDGGYRDPLLWLANGWERVESDGWEAPLYWERIDGSYRQWTLAGNRQLEPHEPVCHVSFYEADAFARWKSVRDGAWEGCRLPTEAEWEQAARLSGFDVGAGTFLESEAFHPRPATAGPGLQQAAGDLWEWTSSHYEAYPGYRPFDGDLMEYNGKFMDNQRVLRGGSCATPANHIRVSYRNFWAPSTRFQLTGIRLARSVSSS